MARMIICIFVIAVEFRSILISNSIFKRQKQLSIYYISHIHIFHISYISHIKQYPQNMSQQYQSSNPQNLSIPLVPMSQKPQQFQSLQQQPSSMHTHPQQQQPIFPLKQYLHIIWDLGIITYGGPMSHIGIFRKRLVQDNPWYICLQIESIKDQKFVQLLTICQSIPGPTSTQLLTAISMYATSSFIGGMIAFIVFSLPAFIAMFTAVIFLQNYNVKWIMEYVLPGFRVVAVAVIAQAFIGLYTKITNQRQMMAIVFVSAIAYYFKPQTKVILLLFLVSGVVGYFYAKVSQSKDNIQIPSRFNSPIYGLKNIILFFILLILVIVSLPYLHNTLLIIFSVFYKIGSLVIGGGHVILPIMYSQFEQYKFITLEEFYNGFSLISIMPGPMFNLCIYVGGVITGNLWGSLAAFFGLYLPCILFVLFILPYWQTYRKQQKIKAIISGICSASIGLILTAAVMLYFQQISVHQNSFIWYILVTLIVVLSYGLLHYNYPILAVFALGDIAYIGAAVIMNKI